MATAVGPRALLTAIAAGAVAVLVLWWHSTLSLAGFGGWLTGAGEILGLLAGYSVVVLVLLMARIRPIERVVGADRLARWHAMGGRYVIGLISGHALAITWGYAVTAHTNPVSETATLLTTYPDVLMATVAWFLLLGVALVSARAVRRRMSQGGEGSVATAVGPRALLTAIAAARPPSSPSGGTAPSASPDSAAG